MASGDYECSRCGDEFDSLADGLAHAQRNHGMTRQQAQNEIKAHKRRR